MSVYGSRIDGMWAILLHELGETAVFTPMTGMDSVNAEPTADPDREEGTVRVIPVMPGVILGRLAALGGFGGTLHQRSSYQPKVYYRGRGVLADVRERDQFYFPKKKNFADRAMNYAIIGGPRQAGFGIWIAELVELDMSGSQMVSKNEQYEIVPDEAPF